MQTYSITSVLLQFKDQIGLVNIFNKPRKGKYHPTFKGLNKTWKNWLDEGWIIKSYETQYGNREQMIDIIKHSSLTIEDGQDMIRNLKD